MLLFSQVLGKPEWATDGRYAKSAARVQNKAELLPMIAAAMRTRSRADWIEAFEKAGLVFFDDFFEMPGNWPEWLALFGMSNDG